MFKIYEQQDINDKMKKHSTAKAKRSLLAQKRQWKASKNCHIVGDPHAAMYRTSETQPTIFRK